MSDERKAEKKEIIASKEQKENPHMTIREGMDMETFILLTGKSGPSVRRFCKLKKIAQDVLISKDEWMKIAAEARQMCPDKWRELEKQAGL